MTVRVGIGVRVGLGARLGRRITFFPMGDSITLGAAGDPGGWRKVFADARPGYVGRGSQQAPTGYFHEGYSSYTIGNLQTLLTGAWGANPARELWFTAGTNDIYTGSNAATALAAMDTFLTAAEALANPPRVIRVASITPMTALGGSLQAAIDAFNSGLPAVVATHKTARFHDVGGRLSTAYLSVDNIHPTAAGHALLAQYWAESLGLA